MSDLEREFDACIDEYPETYRPILRANRSRLIWQVEMVLKHVPPGGELLDIGAGIVPFMLLCARRGYTCTIVDDLADNTYDNDDTRTVLALFADAGIKVVTGDAFSDSQGEFADKSFNLVTSHDSLEHWHNSPKTLLHQLWGQMMPNGLLWIGVPNCVNLRKRITVPFGYNKWSTMADWYEEPMFRGHVREPDVDDLRYIARDLGARKVEILGKNWLGYRHPSPMIRRITPFIDRIMQLKPSVCTDLNLFAWK